MTPREPEMLSGEEIPAGSPAPPPRQGRGRRWQWIVVGLLVAAGLAWLWAVDPVGSNLYPVCMLHALTGLHCPSCGSTRAVHALLHGRLAEAFWFNPLLVAGAPLLGLAAVWHSWRARRWSWPTLSAKAAIGVLVLFALARNIPSPETSPLAPLGSRQASESETRAAQRSTAQPENRAGDQPL